MNVFIYLSIFGFGVTVGFWLALVTVTPKHFKLELPQRRSRDKFPKRIKVDDD
jgi:hypothetical protein